MSLDPSRPRARDHIFEILPMAATNAYGLLGYPLALAAIVSSAYERAESLEIVMNDYLWALLLVCWVAAAFKASWEIRKKDRDKHDENLQTVVKVEATKDAEIATLKEKTQELLGTREHANIVRSLRKRFHSSFLKFHPQGCMPITKEDGTQVNALVSELEAAAQGHPRLAEVADKAREEIQELISSPWEQDMNHVLGRIESMLSKYVHSLRVP